MLEKIKIHRKKLLIIISILLVLVSAFTYAYFAIREGDSANTDITATSENLQEIIFTYGDPIALRATLENFGEGKGSLTDSTTTSATLIASSETNNSTANYNVYLNIDFNSFVYTTSDNKPEIIVEVTAPDGSKVASIDGLNPVNVIDEKTGDTISGFDITNKSGRYNIALAHEITSTDSDTGFTQDWTVKVTFVNLTTNQYLNEGKSLDINLLMTQRNNTFYNEIMDAALFAETIKEVTNDTSPLIDEMRFSSTKSSDYETATQKWDVSANPGSEEVIAYIEDHATDGKILHVQANGNVVFYEMKRQSFIDTKAVYDKFQSNWQDYHDENDNYISGTLTNQEISYLCSYSVYMKWSNSISSCIENYEFNVTNIEMTNILGYFDNINNINMSTGIDTSQVTDMSYMFYNNAATMIDVSGLDTSNVTNMYDMFGRTASATLDVSGFDTSQVTNMGWMFYNSAATTLDLSGFDTNQVTNMRGMFSGSSATTLDLSNFDTSQVTDMSDMFQFSSATMLDVSNFDTSSVTDMSDMFWSSDAQTLDLSSFNTSQVTDMSSMFDDSAATMIDVSNFDTSKVTDMSYMFDGSAATTLDLSNFNTSQVTDMSYMFYNSAATTMDVSNFDTSQVTDMSFMFMWSWASTLNLSSFDTSQVTDMSFMFWGNNATIIVISSFDTSQVTDMSGMFGYSVATNLELNHFNTSQVTGMNSMFFESAATIIDVSNFDTRQVTDMRDMFDGSAVTSLNLKNFDFSKIDTSDIDNYENMLYTNSTPITPVTVKSEADKTWLETYANPRGITIIVEP